MQLFQWKYFVFDVEPFMFEIVLVAKCTLGCNLTKINVGVSEVLSKSKKSQLVRWLFRNLQSWMRLRLIMRRSCLMLRKYPTLSSTLWKLASAPATIKITRCLFINNTFGLNCLLRLDPGLTALLRPVFQLLLNCRNHTNILVNKMLNQKWKMNKT